MMIRERISCVLILLFSFCLAAQADSSSFYVGEYELIMSGVPAWQHNGLVIRTFGDPVSGDLHLDLGLGPEARAPKPEEKLHIKSFRAGYEGEDISFKVEVGEKAYSFRLFPLSDDGQPLLAGTVTVTTPHYERVLGCWAKKKAGLR